MSRGISIPVLLPLLWGSVGLCAVAILLGRSAPGSAAVRPNLRVAAAPLVEINYSNSTGSRGIPSVLDTETGEVTECLLPEAASFDLLGFSPWRDTRGQSHVVARRRMASGRLEDHEDGGIGLARYTYPEGRLLSRIPLDSAPFGRVSWAPDGSDKIVFVSEDVLLLHDFASHPEPEVFIAVSRPRPLRWRVAAPGAGSVRFQDPCWPSLPALEGGLIVSLFYQEENNGRFLGPHLWWLRIDTDRAEIVSAAPLTDPAGGTAPADIEERLPCVGTAPDGTPLLAYLSRTAGQTAWDLWVAHFVFERRDDAPNMSVRATSRRKLGEACVGLALAFSADGRSIHVSSRTIRDGPMLPGTLRTCTYRVDGPSASG